jgi:hypothetical protein
MKISSKIDKEHLQQRSLSPSTKLKSAMMKEAKEPRPSSRKIARPQRSLSPNTKLESMTNETKESRPSDWKMPRQRSLSPRTKLKSMVIKVSSSSDRSSGQRRSTESIQKMYSDLVEKYPTSSRHSSRRPGETRRERESVSPTPSISRPGKNNHSDGGLGEQTKSLSPSNYPRKRHSDTSERSEQKHALSQSEHAIRPLKRSDLYSCKRSGKNELDRTSERRSRSKSKSRSRRNGDLSQSDHRGMRRGQRGVPPSPKRYQSRQSVVDTSNLKGELDVLRAEVQVREQHEENLRNEIDVLRQELAEKEKRMFLSPEKVLKGGLNKVKKISGGSINQVKKVTKMLPFGHKRIRKIPSL